MKGEKNMTPNEQIRKTRQELNAMADRCRDMAEDLEEVANGLAMAQEITGTATEPVQGFTAACKLLRSGNRLALGSCIHTRLKDGRVAKWRVIDNACFSDQGGTFMAVQLAEILDYRPFSKADKKHPYGWNNYEASELAAWLENDFFQGMADDDRACIRPRTDLGNAHLWLLSDDEAGFGEASDAFGLFICDDEEERDELRQLKDSDGDAAYWWLRTPNSGNAYYVRNVYTDGTLDSYYAVYAYGVAPACYIG